MFELLAGQPPFQNESQMRLFEIIVENSPPLQQLVKVNASKHMVNCIERLMDKVRKSVVPWVAMPETANLRRIQTLDWAMGGTQRSNDMLCTLMATKTERRLTGINWNEES